jgi:hypothetical protein
MKLHSFSDEFKKNDYIPKKGEIKGKGKEKENFSRSFDPARIVSIQNSYG